MTEPDKLTEDQRAALWRQYAQIHAKAQETYDSSVRTLAAAAGVAVTVTIATAVVEDFDGWALASVTFLVALACNLLSYATAQKDMRARLEFVRRYDLRGFDETNLDDWHVLAERHRGQGAAASRRTAGGVRRSISLIEGGTDVRHARPSATTARAAPAEPTPDGHPG